jgi:hypothetical protein
MDKKTKLWLGAGVLGVGAYLLWKSKQAAAVVTSTPAKASLVGFANQAPESLINSTKVVGGHAGEQSGKIFANQDGNSFYKVHGGHAGVHGQGIFTDASGKKGAFANKPFNFAGDDMDPVGQRKMPFTARVGDNQKFNAGGPLGDGTANFKANAGGPKGDGAGNFSNATGEKDFFNPETKKFGPNQGVFAPKAEKQKKMVGLINGPAVHEVWGK